MDVKQIILTRAQGLKQFTEQNIPAEDVVFYLKNGTMNISLIPFTFEGKVPPPSFKYNMRKQVMQRIIDGALSPEIAVADEVFYCSYDTIYSVDYVFHIVGSTRNVTLYIARDGNIIRRYQNYHLDYDERVDLANI